MSSTKIAWSDQTINPITGCLNGCTFCYARRFALRMAGRYGYPSDDPFKPTFHPDKIAQILDLNGKRGKRIFVDSMSDWFSPGVEREWIDRAIEAIYQKPEHTFLVLTKRPDRIPREFDVEVPSNLWLGVSVTNQADVWRIDDLKNKLSSLHKFISFEPLHGSIETDLNGIDWIILGAETGNRKGKIKPRTEWIEAIRNEAEKQGIPIFLKDNLQPYCNGNYPQRQYPMVAV